MAMSRSLCNLICRHFSSPARLPRFRSKNKQRAFCEAQKALTDYLHGTRLVPYNYAEHISKNSIVSLSNFIANIDASVPATDFSSSVQRFLRYHPINEFEFFYESIGIDYNEVRLFLPHKKFFFSEDGTALSAAGTLASFGFPWNKLGKLCKEESSIFSRTSGDLASRLNGFREYGFNTIPVIGICLAFPFTLSGDLNEEVDSLFDVMKRVFLDFGLENCVETNVDAWYEMCVKLRVFYDLGIEKGKLGDLICRSKNIFVDYPYEVLVQKVDYFCRFDVKKKDVGLLLLQRPEIFKFDLETRLISVKGLLKHFGFTDKELKIRAKNYRYALGRNKMANLPNVMKAMDLNLSFFNKIKDGDHQLLADYVMRDPNEDIDREFIESLERIRVSQTPIHTMSKLDFVHRIGFGENALTAKIVTILKGNSDDLQERFNFLLGLGIPFSKLCVMISVSPRFMNQSPEILERKINFLCQDMKSSLQELYNFPAFLCFNLEKRIKPRYKFHMWLREKGYCLKNYSIASILATSEKQFFARIIGIHPCALKHWLESFSYKANIDE